MLSRRHASIDKQTDYLNDRRHRRPETPPTCTNKRVIHRNRNASRPVDHAYIPNHARLDSSSMCIHCCRKSTLIICIRHAAPSSFLLLHRRLYDPEHLALCRLGSHLHLRRSRPFRRPGLLRTCPSAAATHNHTPESMSDQANRVVAMQQRARESGDLSLSVCFCRCPLHLPKLCSGNHTLDEVESIGHVSESASACVMGADLRICSSGVVVHLPHSWCEGSR